MSAMTNYLELGFLDFWFNNTAFPVPVGLEISWWTGSPTDTGTAGTEVAINGGSRLPVTFAAASGRSIANANQLDIANSAAAGTIDYWAVHRTDLTNQMLCYAPLASPIVVSVGTPVRINAGGMVWDFLLSTPVYTDYVVNNWLDHVFRSVDFNSARPGALYTSLHQADPGDNGINEFSDTGYNRVITTYDPAAAASGGDSWVRNTAQLDWTNLNSASGDPTITHWGVWDALTLGNFLARRDQTNNTVDPGSNAAAAAQALELRVD